MPRKRRFNLPAVPQHIIQRGNNREPCFFAAADYLCYLDTLGAALERHDSHLHAWVLMTNHVHLLISPGQGCGISHVMQDTGRKYVHYINRTYRRSGTLWEGRYKACVIDSDTWLLTCMRYIEMNPVRAGMVAHPADYRWSSHAANALGRTGTIVRPHERYLALGASSHEREYTYRELFRTVLEEGQVNDIRETLNQELVLGREEFKETIAHVTQRQVRRGRNGRPRNGQSSNKA